MCSPKSVFISVTILTVLQAGHGCGTSGGMQRIVGGVATFGQLFPWYTILQDIATGTNMCGGALISSKLVLTAAHCYAGHLSRPKKLTTIFNAILGWYNTCEPNEATKTVFKTAKVYIHEDYKEGELFFDIALLRLDRTASFEPICLPAVGHKPRKARILGYGVTVEGAVIEPCAMRTANVTIFTPHECNNTANPTSFNGKGTFCAGTIRAGIDSCQGDSGGPIESLEDRGPVTILGIVSFGTGCGEARRPGIYTDVFAYRNWINRKAIEHTTTVAPSIDVRMNI